MQGWLSRVQAVEIEARELMRDSSQEIETMSWGISFEELKQVKLQVGQKSGKNGTSFG